MTENMLVVWKPFHKVLTIFRKSWDIRTSVIDSFANFLLLSYTKILSVSIDLLVPTQIFELELHLDFITCQMSHTLVELIFHMQS